MEKGFDFHHALAATRILKPPKLHLATFGTTEMRYVLLSQPADEPSACRVREGKVTAERPAILTPELWKERFAGFGQDADDFAAQFDRLYGSALRALEYRFRNDLQGTTLEHAAMTEMIDRVKSRLEAEDAPRTALLQGPDTHWSLSVMKFILDTTLQSFPGNVRELDERGMFNPEQRREAATRRHIEQLFAKATMDRSQIKPLGEALRAAGLFADYEDRFFALVRGS